MTQSRLLLSTALSALLWYVPPTNAAIPVAEQVLPDDTLAMLTVPNFSEIKEWSQSSAMIQLWNDPSMARFRDRIATRFREEVIEPLEKETGFDLEEYAELPKGQITLAVTRNGWTGGEDQIPGLLVLMDVGDQAASLESKLAEVRKGLSDADQTVRTVEVRGMEFAELLSDSPGKATEPSLFFGQTDSLLIVSLNSRPTDVERVLARLADSPSVKPLAENPVFARDRGLVFRDAGMFGWINAAPLVEIGQKLAAEAASEQGGFGPRPDAIMNALGLSSLKSLAFGTTADEEGESVHFFIGAPEAERRGLFRLPVSMGSDASPPVFAPNDAIGFSRARMSGKKIWEAIVGLANEIAPGMLDFGIAQLESQIKNKNPDFNLREDLIGNFGDDLISYQKAPRENTLEGLNAQPSITLVGSPNPERLLDSLRTLVSSAFGMPFEQREFLGRTIHSLAMPFAPPTPDGPVKINLCASGNYLAVSLDRGILEEFLRGTDEGPGPLRATPGLGAASEEVGGMRTGLFGFQNDKLTMESIFEMLRAEGNELLGLLDEGPWAGMGADASEVEDNLKRWVDFDLLPPYEQIAKYFHFTVYAGQANAGGFSMKMFSPMPPGLR